MRLLIALALLVLCPVLAQAQDIYGTILVETSNGVAVASCATVRVRWGRGEATTTASKDGIYRLKCAAGDCEVTVQFDKKDSIPLKIQVPGDGLGVTLQLHPLEGRWFPIRK